MHRKTIAGVAALIAVGIVGGSIAAWQPGSGASAPAAGKARSKAASGPIAVEAATARKATAMTSIRAIGSLTSDESVQISSEIAGRIAEISFEEGETVEAGAVLVRLDDALAKAELADAQARFELASANNQRASQLSRSGNVTEKAIDEATASLAIARAALELQKVRLAKHVIRAPFAGRVGLRRVSPGSYLAVASPIVNLEKTDRLKVDFKLPEVYLSSLAIGQTVDMTVDAMPGRTFEGTIYAIDPQVDVNGRALRLRAWTPNPDYALRPGLFVRIDVRGAQSREVIMIPESAVVPKAGETFAFRIENGRAVEARIRLGARKGEEVEVLEGLEPDVLVVVAGQQKLRSGSQVEIVPGARVTPTSAPAVGRKSSGRSL
jgi:membrane fusion protein (multidrug efflux system)